MAKPASDGDTDATKTPYTSTQVKTIEIAGPIKITLTTKFDSSHVPPARPSDGGDESDVDRFMEALQPFAQAILAKLDEIRQRQDPS
jgi:hypothetical protein